jgi:SET domain-containing protein
MTDVREDLIALEAEVTILRNDLNKMSSRCATLVDMLNILLQEKSVVIENTFAVEFRQDDKGWNERAVSAIIKGNQTEMFDTGEPTSAYVDQDR